MPLAVPERRQAALQMGRPAFAPSLDQLLVGERNLPLFRRIRALAEGREQGMCRIRAFPGSGLTALLRAACGTSPGKMRPFYLDGTASAGQLPGPAQWFQGCRLICIDRADLLAPAWHAALGLWMQSAQAGKLALVAGTHGDAPLNAWPAEQRDQLQQAPTWVLHPMSDEQHLQMILGWARREGVRHAAPLARALVARGPREAAGLRAIWLDLMHRAEGEGRRPDRVALMHAVRRYLAGRAS